MQSLQFKLSVGLLLAILGVAAAAGVFSFQAAFQEANEMQDDQLRQFTSLVNRHSLDSKQSRNQKDSSEHEAESRFILQTLLPSAEAGPDALPLRNDLPEGLQTTTINNQEWRLFVKTLDSGTRIVAGQQTLLRDEIANDGALRVLTPFVLLVPVLLLFVGLLVSQMFKPLKQLIFDLDGRAEHDISQVRISGVPTEVRPFLVAINRLLLRVSQSVVLQRRFVADAAHELRSPLTALSLQAERLEASDMSVQARGRLLTLKSGLQRSRMLLDQLLALARAQQVTNAESSCISVQQVFREVLEDLIALAEAKKIDLGVVGNKDVKLLIQSIDMTVIVKNIVDNGIRYTPVGGTVDMSVKVSDSGIVLQFDDCGPGIPEEERERVFDPFYRVLGNDEVGSGLGLSIVKAITDRIGADISLGYADESQKSGLSVKISFPPSLICL